MKQQRWFALESFWQARVSLGHFKFYIERVIGLFKNRFTILSSCPLPIPMIKSKRDEANDVLVASIDKIMHTCAILTNLGGSIIYNEKDTKVVESR